LKLKLSRKESSRETPCFEINKPIISSLLRPGWMELQKLARLQVALSPPPPHPLSSFSPPSLLSPREAAASVAVRPVLGSVTRAYSPISSPDLSTQSSPPPPQAILSPRDSEASPSTRTSRSSPSRKAEQPRKRAISTGLAAETTDASAAESSEQPAPVVEPDPATVLPSGRGLSRGRRLLACPLCGAEYALATTLEKHIDRDHREETSTTTTSRRTKRPSRSSDRTPPKKRKTSSPVGAESSAAALPSSLPAAAASASEGQEASREGGTERPKLTEYEIFQSLQLPADRKMVACTVCGQLVPPNTLKRHLAK
jgi:hypothetical protein